MLITTEDVKTRLSGIPAADDEALISQVAEGAWGRWCLRTGREWAKATYTEFFDIRHTGVTDLFLREAPVASVTSVHDDPDWAYGDSALVDPSEYALDPQAAVIHRSYSFSMGFRAAKVVYVAGYEAPDFPGGLRDAVVAQAERMFLRSKRVEGWEGLDEEAPEFAAAWQSCRRRRV